MERQKIFDILMCDDIVDNICTNLDELLALIPEIKDMIGFEHNHPHHHLDVWNHTLFALSMAPKDFGIRLTLLLHDIGKPHSYQDREVRHFKGHPKVSSEISYQILTRLNFNNNEIDELCYLIRQHDNPINSNDINNNYLLSYKLFQVQICDALAHNPLKLEKRINYLLSVNEMINDEDKKENYNYLINNLYKEKNKTYIKR